MTKPIILKAENFDDMGSISKLFIDKGYKIMSSDAKHIIAKKKRNFGIWYFHVLFLGLYYLLLVIILCYCILYVYCV